tara:strand:- start:175 stop:603 length:429 start_codon:yes stop_codon:yes gene_type:complete
LVHKLPHWQDRLHAFFSENKDRDFVWGKWDCVVMASMAVEAMTGHDILKSQGLSWTSELSAYKAIKQYGENLEGAAAKALALEGFKEIPVSYVTAGDVVLFLPQNELITGVGDGARILSPALDGYSFNMPSTVRRAWRIPDG